MHTREMWRCDHCSKAYVRPTFCEKHEEKCTKNPKNYTPCWTCIRLHNIEVEIEVDTFQGSESKVVRMFYCSAKDEYVYPLGVDRFHAHETAEKENNPMPKLNCKLFSE